MDIDYTVGEVELCYKPKFKKLHKVVSSEDATKAENDRGREGKGPGKSGGEKQKCEIRKPCGKSKSGKTV